MSFFWKENSENFKKFKGKNYYGVVSFLVGLHKNNPYEWLLAGTTKLLLCN